MSKRTDLRGAEPEASTEQIMMRIARERGASTAELQAVHLLKALLDAVIVDAEATA